jgi:ring-1,2-phenylacetyl-CoA epoxidase subunit PaaC
MLGAGAREHLLAFADDEHLMGQGHTEWIGVAPFLEEDLAFCSIAQDELGHAAAIYELVADDGDADTLAFRPPADYRSCHLVELPCDDWAEALARHWLYDLAEQHRWGALRGSTDPGVAAIVARAEREESYHRRHAATLVGRLLSTPGEGADRLRAAIDRLLPFADAIWEPVAGETESLEAGVVSTGSAQLRRMWRADVSGVVDWPVEWERLERPRQVGRTLRSEHFETIHDRITEVIRIDPAARW